MTIAATGIDVASLAMSPYMSEKSPYMNEKSPNISININDNNNNNKDLLPPSGVSPGGITPSSALNSATEKAEGNKSVIDVSTVNEVEDSKKKNYTPSEFEMLVMDAADAVAALSIDQFTDIKEEDEEEEDNEIGMVEPPEMPSTPPPPGKQYALVAQPILSEDGEQVISWSYSYQLVDTEQYNMAQKLQEQADMESDEDDDDDDDDDDSVSSDDVPLASARAQSNSEGNTGQIPMRDAINMFQNLDPTSEEFAKLLQSQRMSVLKGDSTLTPAELANLQLQLQQHKEDENPSQVQPPQQFQLFAPNSLMAQREKVNAQRKILEEQQQKIREEFGNVHTGPLLGTVNKDSKKPKLDGGLVGELDRRAREKEILKKMGLYKPPPPQEHLPSYLQKSGGVTSNPHLSMQLNRNSMLMNPPNMLNNPLMRPPPVIQPPLIRNSIIQNPMMNFGQPGFYPPPPASIYGGALPLPPPQGGIIPNPAVPRHIDYEFDDAINIHERDNLAKSWLEKEREKERQRQYERKAEHSMRMSKSFPSNMNNLSKNYSDSENEDEPLGTLAVSSKKKYKKSKDTDTDSSESSSSSESESESSSESESETETESESGTESESQSDTKKSHKKKSKKSELKEKASSNIDVEKNSTIDEPMTPIEKKKAKSSTGGEFEEAFNKKGRRPSDAASSSDTSSSSEDNSYRRSKRKYSSHYSQPHSARHVPSTDFFYRRQPPPPQNVVSPYGNYVNSYNPNMYNRMYSSPALGNVTPGGSRRYSYSESDDSYSDRRHRRHRDRGKRSKRHHRRRSSSESSYSDDSDSSYSSDYSRRRRRRHRHRDKDRSKSSKKSHKKKSSKKGHKKNESSVSDVEDVSKIDIKRTSSPDIIVPPTVPTGLTPDILEELEESFDQFIDECIEMKPKYQVTQNDLYNTFSAWWGKQPIAQKAGEQQPSFKDLESIMIDNGFTLRPWKKSKYSPEPPADGKDVWHNLKIKE